MDVNARRRGMEPVYEVETFYGQLQHIYLVRFDTPCPALDLHEPTTTLIMASIQTCSLLHDVSIPNLDIHFYSKLGKTDVIDITSVQCLVGRVPYAQGPDVWAIVDRSGTLARAMYLETEDE